METNYLDSLNLTILKSKLNSLYNNWPNAGHLLLLIPFVIIQFLCASRKMNEWKHKKKKCFYFKIEFLFDRSDRQTQVTVKTKWQNPQLNSLFIYLHRFWMVFLIISFFHAIIFLPVLASNDWWIDFHVFDGVSNGDVLFRFYSRNSVTIELVVFQVQNHVFSG